ncbi:IclR family transcriptional regulator [Herbiconiux liangxiaofengii]|uniref:IclR family transcriptional regulator n=1 Tax=Herbiconiux liangxiaofengii TaxID=3342795 RepID=UPI0035BB1D6E
MSGADPEKGSGPEYAVPALDKALDILEVLSGRRDGMSQVEIAAAVERSPSQIFRVLSTLERRGYLFRDRQTALYSLSLRLFDLAHRQEPLRALTTAALGPMRRLADETGQSCNLSVLDVDRVRVVAQAESPGDFGFRVRVGATFSVEDTATGAVLSAFDGTGVGSGGSGGVVVGDAGDVLADIRNRGHLERADALQPSITDVVFPILGASGGAVAALTVPYVATSFSAVSAERVREAAGRAAAEISASLGL